MLGMFTNMIVNIKSGYKLNFILNIMADTIDNTEVKEIESTQAVRYINGKMVSSFIIVIAITIGGVTIYKKFWKEDTQKNEKKIENQILEN